MPINLPKHDIMLKELLCKLSVNCLSNIHRANELAGVSKHTNILPDIIIRAKLPM